MCAGHYDGIAPLVNSEAIAAQIPDSRSETFKGGHLFMLQDPRSLVVTRDFLPG